MNDRHSFGTAIPTDEEVERALRRAWFPVARSSDLTSPREVTLLGEQLVIFRAGDGKVAAASNHCPHRGAALSGGWVKDETIVCPYHGWRWRAGDGRCMEIPSVGPLPEERANFASRAVLPSYRAEEKHGLIWCCLDEPAVVVPSPPEFDYRWTYGWVDPVTVASGIRSATENFRDVAHFPYVHRGTMGEVPPKVEPLKVRRVGQEVWLERTYVAEGGVADMYEAPDGRIHFTYHSIAPAFVFIDLDYGSAGHRLVMQAASPISASECTIYLGAGVSDDYTEGTAEDALRTEAQVLAEDIPILNSLWPPDPPLDGAGQTNTAADRYTLEVRKAFIEFVLSVKNQGSAPVESVQTVGT